MTITRRRKRTRAIALITTMAALVVVAMLVGAFLATRQSLISLTRVSAEQQACRDTLRSLANFCRFQLEGNTTWGATPGNPDDSKEYRDAAGQVVFKLTALTAAQASAKPDFAGLTGKAFFEGEAPRAGVRFAMVLSNNLENEDPAAGVAGKSCTLQVRALRGSNSDSIEVVMRKASFFDSTVAASGDIDIDAQEVNFSSNDPLRNQIRSKAQITLPKKEDIVFTPDPDMQTPEKGTVWAAGDITVGETTDADYLRDVVAIETGGEFLPNAPTRYSVPQLKKSDLDSDGSKPIVVLRPVVYEFRYSEIHYLDTDGVEHTRSIPLLAIGQPSGDENSPDTFSEFHFAKDALLQPLDPLDPSPPPLDHVPDPDSVTMEEGDPPSPTPVISSEDGTLPVEGATIKMPVEPGHDTPGVEFAAEYDYRVKSAAGSPADFKIRSVNVAAASVNFKDNDPDPEHPQEGLISADRDLIVEGYLGNCGKLLAGRDVRLMPRDVTVDNLEDADDLAVFGGRDVTIVPLFTGDEALRDDLTRYFVFRGLVYAEREFKFLSSVAAPEGNEQARFNRQLLVEGALVARRGNVYIQGKESVELKYNRKFLDDLMEKTFEGEQAQLEELSWRPL